MQEVLDQVTEQPTEQVQEEEQEETQQEATQEKEDRYAYNAQEKNMRELREKSERIQRERDEYERRLREQEEYLQSMQQQQKQEPEEDFSIGDDDLLEGKHLKAWQRKQQKELEELKRQYQQQQQELVQQTTEMRIKTAHPDYDKVVNNDNIQELKRMYPDVARTIADGRDLYSQAVTAYTLIKNLGIHREDTYRQDRERAQKNLAKPQTATAAQKADSPMGYANEFDKERLSDERKRELYLEMKRFAR